MKQLDVNINIQFSEIKQNQTVFYILLHFFSYNSIHCSNFRKNLIYTTANFVNHKPVG